MSIAFSCECGKKFLAKDEHAGRRAICPACKRPLKVPIQTVREPDEPSIPVPPSSPQPEAPGPTAAAPADTPRPFRKYPLVVIGVVVPLLILIVPFGYSVWRSKIPFGVSYTVVEDYKPRFHYQGAKRTVSVRLNKRVSKEVLREISREVKSLEKEEYEITDVCYFLPGMDTSGWLWARLRSSPEENWVMIIGLTEEEKRFLENEPISLPDGSEPIGSWLEEWESMHIRLTTYKKNNIYYLQNFAGKGAEFTLKLREVNPSVRHDDSHFLREGHDFQPDNGSIDHYVIDAEGKLRIYGYESKLLTTPEIIKPPLSGR